MRKLLAVFLVLIMALMPTLSMAESLLDQAIQLDQAVTDAISFEMLENVIGDETMDAAIHDLLAALTVSAYAQKTQGGVSVSLDGTEVFAAEAAAEGQNIYVKSPWLGEDTLAFSAEELQELFASMNNGQGTGISCDMEAAQALFSGNADLTALFPQTIAVAQTLTEKMVMEPCDEAPYTQKITFNWTGEDIMAVEQAAIADFAAIAESISLKVNGEDVAAMIREETEVTPVEVNGPIVVYTTEDGSSYKMSSDFTADGTSVAQEVVVAQTETGLTMDLNELVTTEESTKLVSVSANVDMTAGKFECYVSTGAPEADEPETWVAVTGERIENGFEFTYAAKDEEGGNKWANLTLQAVDSAYEVTLAAGEGTGDEAQTKLAAMLTLSQKSENQYTAHLDVSYVDENGENQAFWGNLDIIRDEENNGYSIVLTVGAEADQPAFTVEFTCSESTEGAVVTTNALFRVTSADGTSFWEETVATQDNEAKTATAVTTMGSGDTAIAKENHEIAVTEKKPSIATEKAVHILSLPEEEQQEWLEAISQSVQMGFVKLMQSLPASTLQLVSSLTGN